MCFPVGHWKVQKLQTDELRKGLTASPAEGSDASVLMQMLHNSYNLLSVQIQIHTIY